MIIIVITMFFGGGLIPTYLVVKKLGMVNKIWALFIPSAVGAWHIIVSRTFFSANVPDELLEASRIDGCSNTRFFAGIVLPLSKALIAVMVLFYSVNHWNSYFPALIYLRNRKLYPLQLILREILVENEVNDSLASASDYSENRLELAELIKYGVIIVSSLPLLILYPFVQKYFIKGVMIGSIKG